MNIQDLLSSWGGDRSALVARASEHLPFWLSIGLIAAIGYYLARLVWVLYLAIWPATEVPAWQPPERLSVATSAPAGSMESYRTIIAAHLFGEPSADAPVATVGDDAADTAPDTTLSLQLRGAIAADDPKFAHAIIADSTGTEKVYFVKDSIPGGASLERVQADRVVLRRGGQLEVLRLPRLSEGGTSQPAAAASARPAVLRSMAPSPAENVQTAMERQAGGFLDVVRPQPFMPNGQLRGYRVYPGPNRQQFGALGLRPGDLVTEINGLPLNNPAQGMEVFRSLGDATELTVTVERDGQPNVLSLNLSEINALDGATQ